MLLKFHVPLNGNEIMGGSKSNQFGFEKTPKNTTGEIFSLINLINMNTEITFCK